MSGPVVIAGFLAWSAWALMLAVGILHSTGAVDWTLGYDQAAALVALLVPPVVLLAGVTAAAASRAARK